MIAKFALVALAAMLSGCAEPGSGGVTHPGEETYNRFCFSCHASGVGDAPKFGDAAAWAPRIAKGEALLLRSTVEGMPPGMPAMGLCLSCSQAELAEAIDYMVSAAQ